MRRKNIQEYPWLWLLPVLLSLVIFYLYPMLDVARLSFSNATLIRDPTRYGFFHYISFFTTKDFAQIMKVTFIYVIGSLIFQVLIGLLIAFLVHTGQKLGIKGAVFTRTVVLSCWIIPAPAIGIIWKILLSEFDYGIINYVMRLLIGHNLAFLSSEYLSIISVTIANIWCGTAFSMLILYSGFQQIPEELYEAAMVDGANGFQKFRYITLPSLRTFLFTDLSLATIYTFNSFGLIMALTAGGPGRSTEVLALSVYRTIFERMNLGRGAALSMVLLMINLISAVLYNMSFIRKGETK
ncbi:carbohydrate ABC transporter permease [Breznakiella homolactica]|uniref:Sugar ABC transporter permease n=1 Tax=Breznakiella homolactica TaxID=2798577 RepID=A0A7T8BAK0_9SPIR|nr:sugar ABC transporter permease [Breznakiella homolactica]QQO10774.1 sugar ABC transporter permease [Breznakiella homolactica]